MKWFGDQWDEDYAQLIYAEEEKEAAFFDLELPYRLPEIITVREPRTPQ